MIVLVRYFRCFVAGPSTKRIAWSRTRLEHFGTGLEQFANRVINSPNMKMFFGSRRSAVGGRIYGGSQSYG